MTVQFSAPTLTTPRLTLRAPRIDDFDAVAAFYASPRSEFVGGPISAELAWRTLAQEAGHWVLRGFGRWTVVETATQTPVGIVGLWCPEGFPENELGWDLFEGATGKGYATEAATAARQHAYDTLGWRTLISLVAHENHASRKVAQRLGAHHDGDFTHERWGPLQIWRHPGPEALT
ncbi:GNAT family N-acetyltransferase [Tateyamaria sp. SN6-1]|uniref:GNAT family N-acetyltransferase n=1 Tax=Tateyamaria sp. SN6-1 TaxID=3092148 RepID=UPI0039F577C0